MKKVDTGFPNETLQVVIGLTRVLKSINNFSKKNDQKPQQGYFDKFHTNLLNIENGYHVVQLLVKNEEALLFIPFIKYLEQEFTDLRKIHFKKRQTQKCIS